MKTFYVTLLGVFTPSPILFCFIVLFSFGYSCWGLHYFILLSQSSGQAESKEDSNNLFKQNKKKLHIINKSTQFLFGLILYTIWKRFATFYLLQLACVNWTCLKKPTKICNFCPLMRILKQCSIRDCTRTSKIGSYLHNNPQPTPTHSPYRIK